MSLAPAPTAGSPALQVAPTPNPVPFNFAAGQLVSSAQANTNGYAIWSYLQSLASALNGATYCPAPAISAVAIGAGRLTASVGTATPGTGTQLSLDLAHGDYVDLANAQTIAGVKTFSANVQVGPNAPSTANFVSRGTTDTFPYLQGIYDGRSRIVIGSVTMSIGTGNAAGVTNINFSPAFAGQNTYVIHVQASNGVPGWGGYYQLPLLAATRTSASQVSVYANSVTGATASSNYTLTIDFIAIGY